VAPDVVRHGPLTLFAEHGASAVALRQSVFFNQIGAVWEHQDGNGPRPHCNDENLQLHLSVVEASTQRSKR
jgi:hypothetical protein